MFGFFKKKKDKLDKPVTEGEVDISHMSDAKQQLMAQLREKRAEIGEENLQKMASALHHEKLRQQIQKDIETDEEKRNRLLDEIRSELRRD